MEEGILCNDEEMPGDFEEKYCDQVTGGFVATGL